jgi:hypothetical protein
MSEQLIKTPVKYIADADAMIFDAEGHLLFTMAESATNAEQAAKQDALGQFIVDAINQHATLVAEVELGLTLTTGNCIACKLNKADELEYQIKQTEITISTLQTVLELAEGELVMLYKKTGISGQRMLNTITRVLGDTKEKI